MAIVIVNDGQQRWAADKAELIEAMDRLGWEKAMRLGQRARVEPDSDSDLSAYTRLCSALSAQEMPESADELQTLTYYPAERAWLWSIA